MARITTDDEVLGTRLDGDDADCWLADRAAVRALVAALPICACGDLATRGSAEITIKGHYGYHCCDACADPEFPRPEMLHAHVLRALLARMRAWDGDK